MAQAASRDPGVVLGARAPSQLSARRQARPRSGDLNVVRNDGAPRPIHASRRDRVDSPQRRTSAHFNSSPTTTNVSQTRLPTMWRVTHAGARSFWRSDATSVSITTSNTVRQAIEALRDARRSTRNDWSSSSLSHTSAASSAGSRTSSACCWRARSAIVSPVPAAPGISCCCSLMSHKGYRPRHWRPAWQRER